MAVISLAKGEVGLRVLQDLSQRSAFSEALVARIIATYFENDPEMLAALATRDFRKLEEKFEQATQFYSWAANPPTVQQDLSLEYRYASAILALCITLEKEMKLWQHLESCNPTK